MDLQRSMSIDEVLEDPNAEADSVPKEVHDNEEDDDEEDDDEELEATVQEDEEEDDEDEVEQKVREWWKEEKTDDRIKWKFLEHKGPVFAPPYKPLPINVRFFYAGEEMRLSQDAEEVACLYARMLDHEYTTKPTFNKNFLADWRKVMTHEEATTINDLSKCNFKEMQKYLENILQDENKAIKDENKNLEKDYGFGILDGYPEKISKFRIESPGLFRGRGDHPKMGMLKKRVKPDDIEINCSKDSNQPVPPPGHKWKTVINKNTVSWLASWTDNVQNTKKYIKFHPNSSIKGRSDFKKYETARNLHKYIDIIEKSYFEDMDSPDRLIKQRAVALYLIHRLALRAGNEKGADQADTVGCCSLRVEHIQLYPERDGEKNVVVIDFCGKDSVKYYKEVPIEHESVFINLQRFKENKEDGQDLFDKLTPQKLNEYLKTFKMPGLTTKVFRTYTASMTFERLLKEYTNSTDTVAEKIKAYERANKEVAVLCNHRRTDPKEKNKRDQGTPGDQSVHNSASSKRYYNDPRISVAWCKTYGVPIEKIFSKSLRKQYNWAIALATADWKFPIPRE